MQAPTQHWLRIARGSMSRQCDINLIPTLLRAPLEERWSEDRVCDEYDMAEVASFEAEAYSVSDGIVEAIRRKDKSKR